MATVKKSFKDRTGKPVPKKPSKKSLEKELAKKSKSKSKAIVKVEPEAIIETPESRKELAVQYDSKIRTIERDLKGNFVDMGSILIEMEKRELWKELEDRQGNKFKSFDRWLKDAAPFSRASGYAAKESMKRLIGFIPVEELKEMPRFAVETIAKLPKEKRASTKIRHAAKTQSRKKFTETVQKEAPEAHIEQKETIRVDASAKRVADRAIEVAQWIENTDNIQEAMEAIFSAYLQAPCEMEGFESFSNEEAYLKTHPVEQEATA